jgi:hypothetical protein
MGRVVGNRDGIVSLPDLQHHIHEKRAVGIEPDSGAPIWLEARVVHFKYVLADRQHRERVSSPAVAGSRLLDAGTLIDQADGCLCYGCTRWILNRARDAAAHPCPS